MSKFGVGIGEDFPVDETRANQVPPGDDAAWAAHHEAHRQWRQERREWKRRWREEWRNHRRRFRAHFHDSYWDGTGSRPSMVMGHPYFWNENTLWRVLAIVGVVALIVFAFTHIYFILGALVVGALCVAAARHGFDPFDLPPRDVHSERPTHSAPPADGPRDSAN